MEKCGGAVVMRWLLWCGLWCAWVRMLFQRETLCCVVVCGWKRRSRRVVCGRGLTCRHPGLSVLFCLSSECWDAVWWVMGGCTFSGCCSGRFQGWCGGEDCRSCTSIFVSTKDGTVWRWCGSWVEGRALYRQVVACERFWLDGLGGCCLLAEWWWMEWWRRSRNVRKLFGLDSQVIFFFFF